MKEERIITDGMQNLEKVLLNVFQVQEEALWVRYFILTLGNQK
jgi:hypothetical protein